MRQIVARPAQAVRVVLAALMMFGAVQSSVDAQAPRRPWRVTAAVETNPVRHGHDAADDICIWIHPTEPALSTVIGTDKKGGLSVYDVQGHEIHRASNERFNNVDIRYNFPLGGNSVALVVAGNRTRSALSFFRVDPVSRRLVAVGHLAAGMTPTGTCMYYSARRGQYYAFVDTYDSSTAQWRLFDAGDGSVTGELVRSFKVADLTPEQVNADGFASTEACVVDDETGALYLAEEDVALWKYEADPEADVSRRTLVHEVTPGGLLEPDIEGLALYYGPEGRGYLIVSNQERNEFAVFAREAGHRFLGKFSIAATGATDGVSHTDGIDVTNAALGPSFPLGMFVAQDDRNRKEHQNFKLVRWEEIARSFKPPLIEDTSFSPRAIGAPRVHRPELSERPGWNRILAVLLIAPGVAWAAFRIRRRLLTLGGSASHG